MFKHYIIVLELFYEANTSLQVKIPKYYRDYCDSTIISSLIIYENVLYSIDNLEGGGGGRGRRDVMADRSKDHMKRESKPNNLITISLFTKANKIFCLILKNERRKLDKIKFQIFGMRY